MSGYRWHASWPMLSYRSPDGLPNASISARIALSGGCAALLRTICSIAVSICDAMECRDFLRLSESIDLPR